MTAKELREKRMNLANQAKEILDKAQKEGRELNAEETKSFDAIHADIESLGKQVERIERQDRTEAELRASQGTRAGRADTDDNNTEDKKATEARESAFKRYLRVGMSGLNADEQRILSEHRDQSSGTNSAGGYAVAPAFGNRLVEALKAFGGMRKVATAISTDTGATMPFPTDNDTGTVGEILSENSSVNTADVTLGVVNIGAFMYSSKAIKVSLQLLQDFAFDLEGYLIRKLTQRIGRIQNTHFTVGTGSGQPNGLVTASTLGKTGASGQVASVIYNDLIDLIHSIDPSYREAPNCGWMFRDSTLQAIKKLVDSQGHPLWQPDVRANEPDKLLGYPFVINQDVAAMAASAKSIVFGAMDNYLIRDVKDISVLRLNERYADSGQVGFIGWARADGNLLDAGTHPVKYYQNAAS